MKHSAVKNKNLKNKN